jgi:integral membrane protein (TIGR01906 family)
MGARASGPGFKWEDHTTDQMRGRWAVIGWVVSVAIALLLVTSAVRISANSLWLYEQLFERNDVPQRTGISVDGLRDIGAQIVDYFGSDAEPLDVRTTINGVEVSLFGDDENAHLADVKQLFIKTYLVQTFAGLTAFVIILVTAYRFRRSSLAPISAWLRHGALVVLGGILVVGVAATVAFNQVFLLFHYIGFPQGNFTFSSRDDYLVRVFPNGFWSDITFVIGLLAVVGAAMVYALGVAIAKRAHA